jgi:hypothetical protein
VGKSVSPRCILRLEQRGSSKEAPNFPDALCALNYTEIIERSSEFPDAFCVLNYTEIIERSSEFSRCISRLELHGDHRKKLQTISRCILLLRLELRRSSKRKLFGSGLGLEWRGEVHLLGSSPGEWKRGGSIRRWQRL